VLTIAHEITIGRNARFFPELINQSGGSMAGDGAMCG